MKLSFRGLIFASAVRITEGPYHHGFFVLETYCIVAGPKASVRIREVSVK